MTKYSKGEWTNARYDICEIECDGEVYCTVATKDVELIIRVLNENEDLKQSLSQTLRELRYGVKKVQRLAKENEELKQRNNRQYEQLGRLYNLIEQKDWRALNDILDDFKRCEEQLQREWGAYGDVE